MNLQAFRECRAAGNPCDTGFNTEEYIDMLRDEFEIVRKHHEKHRRVYVYFAVFIQNKKDRLWLNWMTETKYEAYSIYAATTGKHLLMKLTEERQNKGTGIITCIFFPKGMTDEEISFVLPQYKLQ